jgi:hypothetical protein
MGTYKLSHGTTCETITQEVDELYVNILYNWALHGAGVDMHRLRLSDKRRTDRANHISVRNMNWKYYRYTEK